MTPAFRIERPSGEAGPVVYDSPHSGSIYPDDFGFAIDPIVLREAEDAHVDELFACAPKHGAPLLHALFPRSYIDPNRHETDLDTGMIEGGWDGPADPGPKTLDRGVGLIWQRMRMAGPIYDRTLTRNEVRSRIETCWRPYHSALERLIRDAHARHGICYHIDCHSMPSRGDAESEDGPVDRADFVIGDRNGTTCEPAFTHLIVSHLRGVGYEVKINDPYKGVELVRRYSDPAAGRHSVQIEVNRRLFVNEATLTKTEGYLRVEAAIASLIEAIAGFAESRSRVT